MRTSPPAHPSGTHRADAGQSSGRRARRSVWGVSAVLLAGSAIALAGCSSNTPTDTAPAKPSSAPLASSSSASASSSGSSAATVQKQAAANDYVDVKVINESDQTVTTKICENFVAEGPCYDEELMHGQSSERSGVFQWQGNLHFGAEQNTALTFEARNPIFGEPYWSFVSANSQEEIREVEGEVQARTVDGGHQYSFERQGDGTDTKVMILRIKS